MGLLLSHKSKLRLYGDMLTVSDGGGGNPKGGGKRGEIQAFSDESRLRLFQLLHQLRFEKVHFVTLTYPGDYGTWDNKFKKHLKEYRRRFEERYGKIQAVWRLEFQKRGAPHFHIMYLDCPFIPVQEWNDLWEDITHKKYWVRAGNGLDLKVCTNANQAPLIAFYLAKYVAKVDENPCEREGVKPGRFWGKWNIEEPEPVEFEVSNSTAWHVVNTLIKERKFESYVPPEYTRCTLLGETMGGERFKNRVIGMLQMKSK